VGFNEAGGVTGYIVSGSGTTYTVTVTAAAMDTIIRANVPAGAAVNAACAFNADSTSADNTVAFGNPPEGEPEGSEEGAPEGQPEGQTEGMIEGEPEGGGEGQPEGGILVCEPGPFHAADTLPPGAPNNRIVLSEFLRVIQFFNAGSFGCQPGTEDGYAPLDPDHDCCPHDTDFNKIEDWAINLVELSRIIQLFNLRGYVLCSDKNIEDGFCAARKTLIKRAVL